MYPAAGSNAHGIGTIPWSATSNVPAASDTVPTPHHVFPATHHILTAAHHDITATDHRPAVIRTGLETTRGDHPRGTTRLHEHHETIRRTEVIGASSS